MRMGAHVSTSGGLSKSVDRAKMMGAETIQIFASSPRMWRFNNPSKNEVLLFRQEATLAGIHPIFIHASYLITLGGSREIREKSIDLLTKTMNFADQIGATGVIFHVGAHHGSGLNGVLTTYASAIKTVLANSPEGIHLIFENSAGMGSHMCSSFQDMGKLLRTIDNPRAMVCLDTQHAFAAGYDLSNMNGVEDAMGEFDREISLSKLVAVHANDSKIKLGGGVDRHENIGDGHLGTEGFQTIISHPAFSNIPFILEVPGTERKGPDKKNLDCLKAMREKIKYTHKSSKR